jgi:hypothetical protein
VKNATGIVAAASNEIPGGLGITAETEEKCDLAIQLAKVIAYGMQREQVESAKSAAAQIAEGM